MGGSLVRSRCRETSLRRRRLRVAAAGYAVVAVFGVAFILAQLVWRDGSTTARAVAAAVVATPLALAFIGDRITRFKLLSLEVSLTEVNVVPDTGCPTRSKNSCRLPRLTFRRWRSGSSAR